MYIIKARLFRLSFQIILQKLCVQRSRLAGRSVALASTETVPLHWAHLHKLWHSQPQIMDSKSALSEFIEKHFSPALVCFSAQFRIAIVIVGARA